MSGEIPLRPLIRRESVLRVTPNTDGSGPMRRKPLGLPGAGFSVLRTADNSRCSVVQQLLGC